MAAVRVEIHGKVQDVFFRDSCRREAQRLGVGGWVRNASGGSVEAVFEGEPDAVRRMVRWCNVGPPQARVEQVDVSEEAESGLDGFEVRD